MTQATLLSLHFPLLKNNLCLYILFAGSGQSSSATLEPEQQERGNAFPYNIQFVHVSVTAMFYNTHLYDSSGHNIIALCNACMQL